MACSESHNWFTALAQRWHVQVVTITLEDDLLSQYGEKLPKHAITKTSDMLFFAGPCTGGSSWARLNITRGPTTSKLIQNKQLEVWKLFKVFSQLKRHAESKKAAILFELPKSREYWKDERLKKQIQHGESHAFDGCRYGLKQRYAKKPLPIRKPWRVISWNFDLGESLSNKCNGNHSHGPCAGRETKDTQLYTSLIVNLILRLFAARAKCSQHHGVNLASPCIFKGFAEKKKRPQGERSSTSTSPPTTRTHCGFISAISRGEHSELWLLITPGLPVEGWWSCTPPGSGKSGVIGSFLQWCFCIFLCLRLRWIAEMYIFKIGDDSINSEEYLFVSASKSRHGAFYCASLVEKYVAGLRVGSPLPRIDEDCSEVVAARWIAEAGVPALYATSAYFSMKTTKVPKGAGHSVSWCSQFVRVVMNHLSQQECLMKWGEFCGKGRRLTQTLAAVASENSMKEKAAPILRHFIDPEIVKVIVNIWELMTALTKDIDGQPGTNIVKEDQTVGDVRQYFHERQGPSRMHAESTSTTLWLEKSEKRFTTFRDAYWVQTHCAPKARVCAVVNGIVDKDDVRRNLGCVQKHRDLLTLSAKYVAFAPDAILDARPRTSWN